MVLRKQEKKGKRRDFKKPCAFYIDATWLGLCGYKSKEDNLTFATSIYARIDLIFIFLFVLPCYMSRTSVEREIVIHSQRKILKRINPRTAILPLNKFAISARNSNFLNIFWRNQYNFWQQWFSLHLIKWGVILSSICSHVTPQTPRDTLEWKQRWF